ncbi:hypothetical protein HDG33_003919 [Paraburkholderia sp. Cpub6]|nr:hypothetical protein [Paraburkholderia sp. Cpub6]
MALIGYRRRVHSAKSTALVERFAVGRCLNPVERTDTLGHFGVQCVRARCKQLIELSSSVYPNKPPP